MLLLFTTITIFFTLLYTQLKKEGKNFNFAVCASFLISRDVIAATLDNL